MAGTKDVESAVCLVICEQLGVDESQVTPEAKFVEDLGADSLDFIELVLALENEFNLMIPDEDVQGKVLTVQNLIDYVGKRINS